MGVYLENKNVIFNNSKRLKRGENKKRSSIFLDDEEDWDW